MGESLNGPASMMTYIIKRNDLVVGVIHTDLTDEKEMKEEVLDKLVHLDIGEVVGVAICILKNRGYTGEIGAVRQIVYNTKE